MSGEYPHLDYLFPWQDWPLGLQGFLLKFQAGIKQGVGKGGEERNICGILKR